MRRRPASAESVGADDLVRLSQASRRIAGLLDASTLARRAAREFGVLVGTDASGVSTSCHAHASAPPGSTPIGKSCIRRSAGAARASCSSKHHWSHS